MEGGQRNTQSVDLDLIDAIDETDTRGLHGARLAATVILVRDGRDGLEVWIQERQATMRNYPGYAVFPGGGVDPRDFPGRHWDSGDLWSGPSVVSCARTMGVTKYKAHALIFAAARELFEEAGILLAGGDCGPGGCQPEMFSQERPELESHRLSFTDFLEQNRLHVDAGKLLPWSRWVGVVKEQTFDTFFFLACVPEGQEPDGNTPEATDAGWFPPQLILDGWRAGLVRLVIPTWAQLLRLSRYRSVAEAVDDASFSDLRPVVGDPRTDQRYREFFITHPIERI